MAGHNEVVPRGPTTGPVTLDEVARAALDCDSPLTSAVIFQPTLVVRGSA